MITAYDDELRALDLAGARVSAAELRAVLEEAQAQVREIARRDRALFLGVPAGEAPPEVEEDEGCAHSELHASEALDGLAELLAAPRGD